MLQFDIRSIFFRTWSPTAGSRRVVDLHFEWISVLCKCRREESTICTDFSLIVRGNDGKYHLEKLLLSNQVAHIAASFCGKWLNRGVWGGGVTPPSHTGVTKV